MGSLVILIPVLVMAQNSETTRYGTVETLIDSVDDTVGQRAQVSGNLAYVVDERTFSRVWRTVL